MSWATNWDGMRYDIVFYGNVDALDTLDGFISALDLCLCEFSTRCVWLHRLPHDSVLEKQLGGKLVQTLDPSRH